MAVVVLVAINPGQQLARTRDAGRKSGVSQLGHALEAFSTANSGSYVAEGSDWVDNLVNSGELSLVPSVIDYTVAGTSECGPSAKMQNNWCYAATDSSGTGPALVYVTMESASENSKCTDVNTQAYFEWSTADGRGGLVCESTSGDPVPQAAGTKNFID